MGSGFGPRPGFLCQLFDTPRWTRIPLHIAKRKRGVLDPERALMGQSGHTISSDIILPFFDSFW